jgi:hypothetical protein
MTTTHPTDPRPAPTGRRRVVPLLPALFEAFTAAHHRPRHWLQLPLQVRGDVRAIWVSVRAGQTDPWLAALAGWRHRAIWHRPTRPLPTLADLDDAPTTWAADHRAAARETDREIAGQYLGLAAYLITAHAARTGAADPDQAGTRPAGTDRVTAVEPSTRPDTHLLHQGHGSVTAPVSAGQGPAVGAGLEPSRDGVGGRPDGLPAPAGTGGEDRRWAVFLACWRDRFGGVPVRVVEVLADAALTRDRLTGRVVDPWGGAFITGPDGVRLVSAHRLGRLLAGQVDRWHAGPVRLRAATSTHDRVTRYWVEEHPAGLAADGPASSAATVGPVALTVSGVSR